MNRRLQKWPSTIGDPRPLLKTPNRSPLPARSLAPRRRASGQERGLIRREAWDEN